ncbi:MgtC/SapB family protein [Brucella neotomae]|uniref:MgtC/SapB family protein n=1 Tax=Brucella neotomae TaxID=29460 RepID=UPI0015EC2725|nr:MgtC/SapB family protein [Brucella neotomae]
MGGLIGFERQFRHRLAGLRTNTSLQSVRATFVVFSSPGFGDSSPTRVAAQIVSGIGFLGAGIIFKEGSMCAALTRRQPCGVQRLLACFAARALFSHAAVATVFIIAVNALLRPLVQVLEFQAMRRGSVSAYLCNRHYLPWRCRGSGARPSPGAISATICISTSLKASNIEGTNRVEVSATVRADQRQDRLLEQIVGHLSLEPRITSARWRSKMISGGLSGL